MTMTGMRSMWLHAYTDSDDGDYYSVEVLFAPQFTVAQSTFTQVDGDGLHYTGIFGYRMRPDPNGPEQIVTYNGWPSAQPYVYVDRCSGVTFGVAIGADQEVRAVGNLFFW